MEGDERDLEVDLGRDLNHTDCLMAGVKAGLNFVGMSNGNECWGSDSASMYPMVDWT